MHTSFKVGMTLAVIAFSAEISAAQLVDLKNHDTNILKSFNEGHSLRAGVSSSLKEQNRFTDNNRVTHIRMQQYYGDYPIWNAHAVIHVPHASANKKSFAALLTQPADKTTMNGRLYQQLETDLKTVPVSGVNQQQVEKVAVDHYKNKIAKSKFASEKNVKSKLVVYVDQQQKAHWVYQVTFDVPAVEMGALPAKPVYLIDASSLVIYKNWDDIKTQSAEYVVGGGFGGNVKREHLIYDGQQNHLAAFSVKRSDGICYLENEEIAIKHALTNHVMQYPCESLNTEHQVYWSGDFDAVNGGYSPANDAMYSSQVIKQLYRKWYNVPALVNEDGSEMQLVMKVHIPKMDNAYWDGETMNFGDGQELYPLTTLGIAAHEVSHGFTQQHSNLNYEGQSGGMNEAFSDMAAKTAEFYAYGKNTWELGGEIFKMDGESMRYMDRPSTDCYGKEPGTHCSIDRAEQYYEGLNVHYSSGVYNRAFYLLSSTLNWTPRKAFAVMVQANTSYWLPETNYAEGASCAVKAADDLGFDKSAVERAFSEVGVSVESPCTNQAA